MYQLVLMWNLVFSEAHVPGLESPCCEDSYQPSLISVPDPSFTNDLLSCSECFGSLSADLKGKETGLGKFIYVVGIKTAFDFGAYVFEQTMKHAQTYVVKLPIAFPTILCGIIISQHPRILVSSDVACKRESPLVLQPIMLTGSNVGNDAGTSGPALTSDEVLIAELKEMCQELDESIKVKAARKVRLEHIIADLIERAAAGDNAEEEEHEDEESEGSPEV